jgi:hypothetical protein
MVKKFVYILILLLPLLYLSQCKSSDNSDESYYCISCISEHPDSERISIKITVNAENPEVPVIVFSGKFNPAHLSDTVFLDTLDIKEFTVKVPTDQYYSVMALYKDGKDSIFAVDGGKFEAKKISGCQNTCWQISGGSYDVRLKKY